jgi:GlpG protein
MRQIGTVETERHALRLADYLLTQGIRSQVDSEAGGGWSVWVRDEDQVAQGRAIFERFRTDADAAELATASRTAGQLRSEMIAREKEARRNLIEVQSQWTSPHLGRRPLSLILIAVCVLVALLSNFGDERDDGSLVQKLSFAHYWVRGAYVEHYSAFGAASDIRGGEIWRVFTPILLHFGPLHLLFNMLWLHSLGGAIELRRGSVRFGLLILFLAAVSNTAQYWWGGPTFGGMSGVVFGLFGYVWIKSALDPAAGLSIDRANVIMMLFWLGLCMSGLVGRIANAAHLVGLLGGVAVAFAPIAVRRLFGRR